jgi:hypothetical protein
VYVLRQNCRAAGWRWDSITKNSATPNKYDDTAIEKHMTNGRKLAMKKNGSEGRELRKER